LEVSAALQADFHNLKDISLTYQNRVDPLGDFQAVSAKGNLMGNRGVLHDENKNILRKHAHQNWVTCALSFKDRKRTIMAKGRYTELFFLDEATALAAGHRPCAECRRDNYAEFTKIWRAVHGEPEAKKSLPNTIDKTLHSARINRKSEKVTFSAPVGELPDGVMFTHGSDTLLIWKGRHLVWGFDGYRHHPTLVSGIVTVLTPRPLIDVLAQGYTPAVHVSAE